ncbi:MAG: RuBisCO large subunit C-terminal-like domain-containing protein, partial [Candidatus Saccharibacteria bacterium]
MERFMIVYRLAGTEAEAYSRAQDICLEQTVEFPGELIPPGFIRDNVLGQIEDFVSNGDASYRAIISFAVDTAAGELTQLLNVMFGNISIKPGYRVAEIQLPDSMLNTFKGPRFGRAGLRGLLNVPERPLLATALKPMGLSSKELADLAYKFALGGIDIIKDDHGLTDQPYAPFNERVYLCAEAVHKANRETGQNCIYVANITAPYNDIMIRAQFARDHGAGGLMLAPGLAGFDAMKVLADDDALGLPVICHPALLG